MATDDDIKAKARLVLRAYPTVGVGWAHLVGTIATFLRETGCSVKRPAIERVLSNMNLRQKTVGGKARFWAV
jgi:hypothetical protein